MIIAGDVGGTKTRLALYEKDGAKLARKETIQYDSSKYPALDVIIVQFLKTIGCVKISSAALGVPGPVQNGVAKTTNLPWIISEKELVTKTSIAKVKLLNDLAAVAAAVPYFENSDLITLHNGSEDRVKDTFAVLAPGTGLGQAFLVKSGDDYVPLASEGGHVDFAPNDPVQIELYKYLRSKFERVSLERVLCGQGLVNIYEFLKNTGVASEPPELRKRLEQGNPAAVISTSAQNREFEITIRALDIFASILGSQAGNLVLTLMTTGGVYLGGGIPPKIAEKLGDGSTRDAFLKKGRLTDLVKATPLHIIKDDHAALLGLGHLAAKL